MRDSANLGRQRRGLLQRRRTQRGPGSGSLRVSTPLRSRVLAEGLARLDREHFALLAATSRETSGEKALGLALDAMLRDDLARTQRALMRAASGRYGECEHCDRPLSARQIERDPSATLCPRCLRCADAGINFS